jgi:two-component system response regulator
MKTILLVEDNSDDEELARQAFRRSKLSGQLVVARDGREALEILLESEATPRPDLVLLDINLPCLSGLEVLRRLRADARTRTLPVVLLTSSREARDIIEGYEYGCNSYVRKPVDFMKFVEMLRLLDHYWLRLNETPLDGARDAQSRPAS